LKPKKLGYFNIHCIEMSTFAALHFPAAACCRGQNAKTRQLTTENVFAREANAHAVRLTRTRSCHLRRVCVAGQPSQSFSYTAKRVSADSVRVMGEGTDGPSRIGTGFTLDEFFVSPKPCETDCVIYFPKEQDSSFRVGSDQPRYGFQLSLENMFKSMPGAPPMPPLRHVRGMQNCPLATLKATASDVTARVVMGSFAGVTAPPPLSKGVTMLDIEMSAEEEVLLPLDCRRGILVYVLEGVAMFDSAWQKETNYTNEGHVLWFPPVMVEEVETSRASPDAENTNMSHPVPLRVRTHPCSTVRFALLTTADDAATTPPNT